MKKYTKKELKKILLDHEKWLADNGGERANLWRANLWGVNLRRADLRGAYLREANLMRANLRRADLWRANLRGANLWRADLYKANLRRANLRRANLKGAVLSEANLSKANLWGANLWGANLCGADLQGADLQNTVLDPFNIPNQDVEVFEQKDGWCIGYRTQDSPYLGGSGYKVGEVYTAPIFSTCETECHPGIFVLPTIEEAKKWGEKIVEVHFQPHDCHRAGEKWRVRELIVWREI